MATLPDPAAIDFNSVALWAAGITTVIASMGGAAWLAIRKVLQLARTLPAPITRTETSFITTDTVAMQQLAGSLDGLTMAVTDLSVLVKKHLAELQALRDDAQIEAEVERRLKARRRRRPGARKPAAN